MKCKNCGADVRVDDIFCSKCGMNFRAVETRQEPPKYVPVSPTVSVTNENANKGVFGVLNRAFGSVEVLIACIIASAGLLISLTAGAEIDDSSFFLLHAMSTVALVFLWIVWAKCQNGNSFTCGGIFKGLAVITKIQRVITWVAAVLMLMYGFLLQYAFKGAENLDFEALEKVSSSIENISNLMIYAFVLGPIFNISVLLGLSFLGEKIMESEFGWEELLFTEMSTWGEYAFMQFAISAGILVILNLTCYKKLQKCAESIATSASSGRDYFEEIPSAINALYVLAAVQFVVVLLCGFTMESIALLGATGGMLIAMAFALGRLNREIFAMKRTAEHDEVRYRCADCGYSGVYYDQCPSCGSSHKIRM